MAKTEANLKATEDFVRRVLQKNFKQTLSADELRNAAQRLCEAIPTAQTA